MNTNIHGARPCTRSTSGKKATKNWANFVVGALVLLQSPVFDRLLVPLGFEPGSRMWHDFTAALNGTDVTVQEILRDMLCSYCANISALIAAKHGNVSCNDLYEELDCDRTESKKQKLPEGQYLSVDEEEMNHSIAFYGAVRDLPERIRNAVITAINDNNNLKDLELGRKCKIAEYLLEFFFSRSTSQQFCSYCDKMFTDAGVNVTASLPSPRGCTQSDSPASYQPQQHDQTPRSSSALDNAAWRPRSSFQPGSLPWSPDAFGADQSEECLTSYLRHRHAGNAIHSHTDASLEMPAGASTSIGRHANAGQSQPIVCPPRICAPQRAASYDPEIPERNGRHGAASWPQSLPCPSSAGALQGAPQHSAPHYRHDFAAIGRHGAAGRSRYHPYSSLNAGSPDRSRERSRERSVTHHQDFDAASDVDPIFDALDVWNSNVLWDSFIELEGAEGELHSGSHDLRQLPLKELTEILEGCEACTNGADYSASTSFFREGDAPNVYNDDNLHHGAATGRGWL